ncbi:MAG: hypothetical protein IPO21_19775 [Bacteroidales bacterium]|nr:hypothetical protein [Bacteroidales bacterium]
MNKKTISPQTFYTKGYDRLKKTINKSSGLNLMLIVSLFVSILFTKNVNAQVSNIQVGSSTREIRVYSPSNLGQNRPLLISMHGMNQDAPYQQNMAKWELVADTAKFVVVYPTGLNKSWSLSGTTDTDFILAIIEAMYTKYGIDKTRVYLSGFSMGGMMTYYAATRIADKIAAFAPVSGYLMAGLTPIVQDLFQ